MYTYCQPQREKGCQTSSSCCLNITVPGQGQQLGSLPEIVGHTTPCTVVMITIDGQPPLQATADACGDFRIANPYQLADGVHRVCVRVCPCGCCVCHSFCIQGSTDFLVVPIEARMGLTFRTVDVDVLISGAEGPATVYYLLLPPGSPAPTAAEIMNYPNTAALLDGTSATGQFQTTILAGENLYTWALTGLDKPNAPAGVTGVIDGYNYDVYLYIVFATRDSGVLSFGAKAMGMPFDTGRGTADNPFTIRELSPGELQLYPDLLADNPLNEPGVDENARQLENIERLITLYERTDGYYGLANSMTLHYLMTSDINLVNYAAAYGGEGWQSIGDIDGWINDLKETEHLFSGVFSGGGHTITNLSITPTANPDNFVGYRGLFGGVEEGTIRNLTLDGVVINALATAPGQAQFGSLIAIARNPVLEGLNLFNANLYADIEEILIGDTHAVNMGGFVAEIFEGGTVRDITGNNISITSPTKSALALGGFVGFTDKFEAYESYDNIQLSNLTISGYALIGGLAGYMVYGVNRVNNVAIRNITATAPGGESGGLIGRLYVYSGTGDCLIVNSSVQNISVLLNGLGDPGGEIGGLIGIIRDTPFAALSQTADRIFGRTALPPTPTLAAWPLTSVQHCSVRGGQINCNFDGGGLIGKIAINRQEAALRAQVLFCQAVIPVAAVTSNAGGLVGLCQSALLDQSWAAGSAAATLSTAGGLVGLASESMITDCYATGASTAGSLAGGLVGNALSTKILRCYSFGNVSAADFAGGIAGSAADSLLQGNLVLAGAISAATAHRILGNDAGGNTLLSNYALNSVTPVPGLPDPNGLDGGTITSAQIVTTMQSLGWNTATVWNSAVVAALGRPTLLQNPE